jgi:D-alanine-D-alanine ligase
MFPIRRLGIRALVLYNRDFDALAGADDDVGREARAEVVAVARAVADALVESGANVQLRGVRHVAEVVRSVRQFSAHVVVNLCESLGADARYEPSVAAVLERMGVAFTGSSARALRLCLDKQACNQALARAGILAPESVVVRRAEDVPARFGLPLIVKPNGEDGSTGITSSSVVRNVAELGVEIDRVRRAFSRDPLVQPYVEGREINVSLLGLEPMRVLPLAEIDFGLMPPGLPRIVSYASKWDPGSVECLGTQVVDAELDTAVTRRIAHVARRVASTLDLSGYARIDLRLDREGRPFVVDVNPNCCLAPDAGFARAAARAGLGYQELVWQIVDAAIARHHAERPTHTHLACAARAVSAQRFHIARAWDR